MLFYSIIVFNHAIAALPSVTSTPESDSQGFNVGFSEVWPEYLSCIYSNSHFNRLKWDYDLSVRSGFKGEDYGKGRWTQTQLHKEGKGMGNKRWAFI